MSILHVDVLIVGLGPAGSSAARQAAQAGLTVLAIERKTEVGVPVQCAEFIPRPLGRYAHAPNVLVQAIAGMKTKLPSGMEFDADFPGMMIDRAAFDRSLAEAAQQAGAQLRLGCRLVQLESDKQMARLVDAQDEHEVHYQALIAADGPLSTVAARMQLPALNTVFTRQYTVPLLHPHTQTDIWLSNDFPGGYAWLFPKGQVANLGAGADNAFTENLKQPLDALHDTLVARGCVGSQILAMTGGLIPVGGLRERMVIGPHVFVGDAAGLTHPITGAGIAPAVISGERAGEAAAAYLAHHQTQALAEYEIEMRDHFEASLQRAVRRRHELSYLWHTPQAKQDEMHRQGWIAFPEYIRDTAIPHPGYPA